MKKNILIITSSGGGGLKQAAKSVYQKIEKEEPNANIFVKDVLRDWMKGFGWASSYYNWTQRKGYVFLQQSFVNLQKYADGVFWLPLFFIILRTMFKYEIDEIYDTQVVGISAMIKAARLYGHCKKKKVLTKRIVIDLPTDKCTHFFANVKRLSKKDRSFFSLVSIKPLLKKGQTPDEFWLKNCNLLEKDVVYDYFPVRAAFRNYMGLPRCIEPFSISIRTKHKEEQLIIEKLLEKKVTPVTFSHESSTFTIAPQDQVVAVLFGTHPTQEAMYQYIDQFLQIAKLETKKMYLFMFCNDYAPKSIFTWLIDSMKEKIDQVESLIIVPMSFQQEDVIASLFYRSNLTITRSGGSTIMELMAISHGENWIHSQRKKKNSEEKLSYKQLLKGIPAWEAGNADYMHHYYDAKIVTPQTAYELYRAVFK
jgi:hypothetical protein